MKTILLMIMVLGFGPDVDPCDFVQCGAGNDEQADFERDALDENGGFKVLLEKESLYHYIRVTESGGVRHMQFRRSGGEYEESAVNLANPLCFEIGYYGLMMAAFAHHPAPKSVLFIGLGGGTLSMAVAHYFPDAQIDNIELDPDVAAVARDFFGFREGPRMKVYIRDGRVQVRRFVREKRKYDVIFLDAFRGGYIPYHLTTKEFMESIRMLLAPGGIVVNNLRPGFESYHYHRRTLASAFRQQWSYGSGGNVIVISAMGETPPPKNTLLAAAERLQKEKQFTVDLPAMIREGGIRDDYERQGPILTDDYAPTDVLRSIPRE
ncbi:MAG TPA: fused MFS/spermidine synthase [Sedimentisphaerales bacterium]|nr:fused MFS/spermidine synthase [Sedimentisphaerales bacterium]